MRGTMTLKSICIAGTIALEAALTFPSLAMASPDKILLGPHIGDATILSIEGVNSDKAIVHFRRELDDEIEDCARESGGDPPDPKAIARCAKENMTNNAGRIYTRRAFCSRSTLYTEFGNFSMVNHEKEKESSFDGKPYRPIRTDWMDHRSREIVGNCNACNTPQLINTFKVLCPVFYHQLFEGFDPY